MDLETLKSRLTEAETAIHALATGQRVVDVWKDGRRVRFQEGNRGDLMRYAQELRDQIAGLEMPAARPRRRFIPVAFG